jgi:hypothetical protein
MRGFNSYKEFLSKRWNSRSVQALVKRWNKRLFPSFSSEPHEDLSSEVQMAGSSLAHSNVNDLLAHINEVEDQDETSEDDSNSDSGMYYVLLFNRRP